MDALPQLTREEIDGMLVKQLQEELKKRGHSAKGRKTELAEKLLQVVPINISCALTHCMFTPCGIRFRRVHPVLQINLQTQVRLKSLARNLRPLLRVQQMPRHLLLAN